jgi:hypothetical protein
VQALAHFALFKQKLVSWHHPIALAVLVLANISTFPATAAAENRRLSVPHSNLDNPFQAPVFLAGHVALAAGGVAEGFQKGGGAVFLFRPGASDRFLDFLYGLNASMVLQAEYHRVNDLQRVLSGDMIVRRYVEDFSAPAPRKSFFYGLGIGASEVTLTAEDGGGLEIGLGIVAEAGQEWNLQRSMLAYWQIQYRSYRNKGHDLSHWSFKVGAGIPLPW